MPHRFTTPPRRGRTPSKPGAVAGQVQSLTRGLNLLEALAKADGGITLTDLAQRVDLPPSTTHRLLSTLQRMGYVYQGGDLGLWYVGLHAFTVGAGFLANRDFVAQSHAYMRRLMEQSGETANLAILDGTEAVFIAQVQCHEMMRILVKLGSRVPLHASGVGKAIFASLRQVVDYDAAAIYLVNRETRVLEMVSAAGYPDGTDEAFALQIGQGIIGWVVKHGEGLIVPEVRTDPRYVAARPETRSEIAAPMMLEGRTIGVFNLETDREDAYHEGHLEMLSAFAAQAAVAIERARSAHARIEARRLEKELAIARDIQMSFLPGKAPAIPGFDLAGASITHDEVGGDYYDFIPVSETRLGLAIADVSGKGIPAALIMAGFRMSLLAEIRNEFAIRAVMRKVNALLHESTERDKFVTAFYGVLDWKNSVIIFSNAGHNPPLLLRQGGHVEELSEGGLAFGVLPDSHYEERPMPLQPGDVVVFYTDGVSEAENEMSEQWGVPRLVALVREHAHEPSADILEAVVEAVRLWTGERGPSDDLTLMVLRATGPEITA